MKIYLSLITLLFLVAFNTQAVLINEIMPKNTEWIEIHNQENQTLNLSVLLIGDDQGNDSLTCKNIENCSLYTNETLFLIIGENTDIKEITNNSII